MKLLQLTKGQFMKINILFALFSVLSVNLSFAQSFYEISSIQTIELTFAESNWDQIMDTYYSNDLDEKLIGTAVINGVQFDSVGVKYKGNSTYSANNAKNPLHIYLDEYTNQDYDGYESIKLSNGKNDPSFVREVLSYNIARKYMDAPRSNYAQVYINGSYYGLFSNSEAINKDFVERRLDSNGDNLRIKCNPESTFDGNGPSLEYLGTDSSSYYAYYEMKSDYGWQELIDFTYNIANNQGTIETTVDIDRVIWMLAYNNVLVNLDSYIGPFRQNYYLIKDDNDRVLPVVWDMNECLGGFEMIDMGGGGPPPSRSTTTELVELDPFLREGDATYPLINLVYDNDRYRKMYIAHCKTIMEENFANSWYELEADTLQDLIYSAVSSDPNAFYTSTQMTTNMTSSINEGGFPPQTTVGVTELMDDRVTYLQSHYAYQYTQPTISNITAPDEITPYTTANITTEISNATYAYVGYRYSKDEIFTKVEMFDDGAHNDGASGDGIYGASFIVDESNTHFYIYADNANAGIFSPARAEHDYYKISASPDVVINSAIVINELMASNTTTQADQNGEFDDWIELYNNTGIDLSLNGYYLTDDSLDLMQWAFPDTCIGANDYLIIWADKDDDTQTGLHASFKLSASEESVFLVNDVLEIVNTVSFIDQVTDIAYARVPNGTGNFVAQNPTFGSNNDLANNINENIYTPEIQAYPNPFKSSFTIEGNLENNTYSIVNITGQLISSGTLTNDQNTIDSSDWDTGIYILKIKNSFIKLVKN